MATVEHCLYCFEALSASLEKRQPMSLYQIKTSWDAYPKGLEDSDASDSESDDDTEPAESTRNESPAAKKPKLSPAIQRLATAPSTSSNTSTTTSTSSLAPPSDGTPPSSASSSSSFLPPGIGRRTSQRSGDITESPLFVTWNTVSGDSLHLRGCIGTFTPLPLSNALSEYALTSAFEDHRFRPISLRELSSLSCNVTLLTDFEDCADPLDWEIGVHGIRVSFYHHHRRYGSTYLPDVCAEQGWSKEECVVSCMRKSGWTGKSSGGRWRDVADLKLVRYQGKREIVDYEEFERFRRWIENGKETK
jgi:uncharacterized protein (TIGR00296 family)